MAGSAGRMSVPNCSGATNVTVWSCGVPFMTAVAPIRWLMMIGVRQTQKEPRQIVILAAPDSVILDIAGPLEVFAMADEYYREHYHRSFYAIDVVSTTDDLAVRTDCGVTVLAKATVSSLGGAIDTLLIAGGSGVDAASANADLLDWIRQTSSRVRRLGSVCTGAFILAAAGLLRGRRATTHWQRCEELARRYPETRVEPDPIFVCDRGVYTSAGVTAGMDLALALVEEDLGAKVALRVARGLVLYLRRTGGQSQLSAAMALQIADRRVIRELQGWIVDHVAHDLSVSALADRAAMSQRNFGRVFAAETGATPARFVERIRIEAARRRLEESDDSLDQIAAQCGFGSADSMRRAFVRLLKRNPSEFRAIGDRHRIVAVQA